MTPRIACVLLVGLAACYGAAPPHPVVVPLPPMSGGELLDVHTESKTVVENVAHHSSTCPQGHAEGDPACVVTTYTVAEPVTRTHSTASLDGSPVSIAQFRVLTDAMYDAKIAELAELSHHCKRANMPRYLGMGLVLGGLIALGASNKLGSIGLVLGYGGLAAGSVSYGFGYFGYGGRECVAATRLYEQINYGSNPGEMLDGTDAASEMATLAAEFNARREHASAGTKRPRSSMRVRQTN